MLKLKRKKDGDGTSKICICNQPEGNSLNVKCDNTNCLNPWWHVECAGLKGLTAGALKKLTWSCPVCIINGFESEFEQSVNAVSSEDLKSEIKKGISECLPNMVQEFLGKVTPKTDEMKLDMKTSFAEIMKEQSAQSSSNTVPLTKNIIKEAIHEGKQELDNFNERKKRLIIFDADEPVSTDGNTAKTEDCVLFQNVCNSISTEILENDGEIVNIRRMGKRKADTKRPIMVQLKTERAKRILFSNLQSLRQNNAFKHLSINHDRTNEERDKAKELINKADEKTKSLQEDETLTEDAKNWMFVIRGPPWDLREVKKDPQQQA